MIKFRLVYKRDDKTRDVAVTHQVLPRVGEKVHPPDGGGSLTVLTVEHDPGETIWVTLN